MRSEAKAVPGIALVGLGEHGSGVLLPALRNLLGGRLVGLCDVDETRRASPRVTSAGVPVFDSYRELFELQRPQAVILAGPPQMHEMVAADAIDAGIAVLAEKPPASSAAALATLAASAREKRVTTGVGLNFRFAEPIRVIQRYIEAYGLTPVYVSVKHTTSEPKDSLWGLDRLSAFLLAQVIHPLDTLVLLGGVIAKVSAEAYVSESDFTMSITTRSETGVIGHLLTGSNSPKFENVLELITAEDVVFKLDSMWGLSVLDANRIPVDIPDPKRWGLTWSPSPLNTGFRRTGYEGELETFVAAARDGVEFTPSFADALHLYEVLEQVADQVKGDGIVGPR